jgi:hypothetical protein
MDHALKRKLAIGVAGLVVAAGAGTAYAATGGFGSSDDRQALLDDAAKRLDVSPQELENALEGAYEARIDAAVKAGRLTEEQAEALRQRAQRADGLPLLGGGGPGGPGHKGFGIKLGGLDAAAKYLGLSQADLREQLQGGKSLADVAEDRNKSVDGLVKAMADAARADLDEAVKDGKLTDAQRDDIAEDLDERIGEAVRHEGPGPLGRSGPGPGHHGFGFGKVVFGGLDAAADYLGVSDRTLRERLFDGDSLADIARDRNKSVDGLKKAIGDAVRKDLAEAVDNDKLTDAQRDEIVEDLDERIDDIVERDGPGRRGFRRAIPGP